MWIDQFKTIMNEIDVESNSILALKNRIEGNGLKLSENRYLNELWAKFETILKGFDKSKARIVLNNNAFIQTVLPFMKEMYSLHEENLKATLTEYEEHTKNSIQTLRKFKDTVK